MIATADPSDRSVQSTLREAIGRDFISVVASTDQITDYLDQVFGSPDGMEAPGSEPEGESSDAPFGGLLSDRSVMIPRSSRSRRQSADRRTGFDPLPLVEERPSPGPDLSSGSGGLPTLEPPPGLPPATEPAEPRSAAPDKLAELALAVPVEEGSDVVAEAPVTVTPPAGPDELAAAAMTVAADEPEETSAESAAIAADLVAEAVATYQEQHSEEHRPETDEGGDSTETALFPPLAKALVDGGRVSLDDMRGVLEEHDRTGASVARILTAQKLVDEADLMWGMAQEMGLEFVDLDLVGVDFNEMGTLPEATSRHHNVIVIGNEEGTPVVAASNPTDVFAMDDLRTIMGRSFKVVVATRSQISSYIGRAFNSGAEAADMAVEASLGFDGPVGSDSGIDDIQNVTDDAPIVRYVNLLILQALNERASDIHVEPTGAELRIRYRIDGVLHDVSTAPRAISAAVTTPSQGDVRHERRRAPHPPGRSDLTQRGEQGDRSPHGDPADHSRGEGCDEGARQVERGPRLRRSRLR